MDTCGGKEGRRASEGGDLLNHDVNGVRLHYEEHGTGVPLVALHGAAVDHGDIAAAIEDVIPKSGYRRIYPDSPGMGHSSSDGLSSNDDVVSVLIEFIEHVGAQPVMLIGHSYGAYVARGVAARRPDLVLGLALMCPIGEQAHDVPEHTVVRRTTSNDELDPEQRAKFDDYFVIRTAANARRFRDHTWPGIASSTRRPSGASSPDGPSTSVQARSRRPRHGGGTTRLRRRVRRRDEVVGAIPARDPGRDRRRRPRPDARTARTPGSTCQRLACAAIRFAVVSRLYLHKHW